MIMRTMEMHSTSKDTMSTSGDMIHVGGTHVSPVLRGVG